MAMGATVRVTKDTDAYRVKYSRKPVHLHLILRLPSTITWHRNRMFVLGLMQ